jgi:AcrR family transcriptional regulator
LARLKSEVRTMARPKSEVRRSAILEAATRVLVAQGLSAPTAVIAKEAGIPNGSLFTYFETKTELWNQLYLELRKEMAETAMAWVRGEQSAAKQLAQIWEFWMWWAENVPEKRRAMRQLEGAKEISLETRYAAYEAMAGVGGVVDRARAGSRIGKAPLRYVVGLVVSTAETTMDFIDRDPGKRKSYSRAGLEAVGRILG